jgi:hypothetical protein
VPMAPSMISIRFSSSSLMLIIWVMHSHLSVVLAVVSPFGNR